MMAISLFGMRHKQVREAVKAMELAVEDKRAEVAEAERGLRDKIEAAKKELDRLPPAGALVWKGYRNGPSG